MIRVRLTPTLLKAVWRRVDRLTPRRGRACPAAAVLAVSLAQAPANAAGTREPDLHPADAATLRDLLTDVAARRGSRAALLAANAVRRLDEGLTPANRPRDARPLK